MPITKLQLGRRLRAARKACHITQAKAARVLGIARSAVSQMETGQRGVAALELHRLAQLYSRDVGGLLEDRFEESSPVAVMFRGLGLVTEEERSSLAEQDGSGLGKALRGLYWSSGSGRFRWRDTGPAGSRPI